MTRQSASEVMEAMDGEFAGIAEAIGRAEFAFWLGSGISRSVVPPVSELLRKVIVHLQRGIDTENPDCVFRGALREVLLAGGILEGEVESLNFEEPVASWDGIDGFVDRMVGNYSKVLEVPVSGVAAADYLLWDAIEVVTTYGNGALEPDVEHFCLALLLLEGSMPVAVSANWDGLIEVAVERLCGSLSGQLDVVVHQEDLRGRTANSELVKFHGCAVRALLDEGRYRKLLVATKAQVVGWTENPDYSLMVSHLEEVVATRPTLMMGLSGQDANVQAIFARAKQRLPWSWPADPPALVLAEETIGSDQRTVLNLIYGDSYAANRPQIDEACLLGCYAKPFLHAIVLWVVAAKLSALANAQVPASWQPASRLAVDRGLKSLRDELASTVPSAVEVETAALTFARGLAVFRGRTWSGEAAVYEPLTSQPISATPDPNSEIGPLGWLAVCLGFLKSRESAGDFDFELGASVLSSGCSGVLRHNDGPAHKVVVVKDAMALARLQSGGHVEMEDKSVVILHMAPIPKERKRSSSSGGKFGRTRRSGAHELSFSDLASATSDVEALAERFRQQVAV